jgi:hypothetical protein
MYTCKQMRRLWWNVEYYLTRPFRVIYDTIRHVFPFLVRLFQYIPIIWKDHDYDWTPLAEIMLFKLGRMRQSQLNGYHTTKVDDARKIEVAEMLLRRILAEDEDGGNSRPVSIKYNNPKRFAVMKETNFNLQDDLTVMNEDWYQERQDVEYLFRHIGKHLRSWWS